jgi:hypothetical protein
MVIQQELLVKEYKNNCILVSTIDHAKSLAPRLREADLNELKAHGLDSVENALISGVRDSTECYTVWNKEIDKPIAIFGSGDMEDVGYVWMLGSNDIKRIRYEFIRHCKDWLAKLLERYSIVYNVIDVRNKVHMRWLKFMGFEFGSNIEINGYSFKQFWKVK